MSQITLEYLWDKLEKVKSVIDQLNNHHKKNIQISRDWVIGPCIDLLKLNLDIQKRRSKSVEEKIKIKEIKIFFIGKISVGKSKVINALLGNDLFLTALSYSTSCFVHVTKSSNNKYSIKYRKDENDELLQFKGLDDAKKKIKELTTCHPINYKNESIYFSMVCTDIRVSKILRENIEIVDCPGSTIGNEITNYLKENSLEADIFILVSSNYYFQEKDKVFFEYTLELSNIPEIFFLFNACDKTDNDIPNKDDHKRKKIISRCENLVEKIYSGYININERIFFISASEMLKIRIGKVKIDDKDSRKVERIKEFENFEKTLLHFIDHSKDCKEKRYHDEFIDINNEIDNAFEMFREQILLLRKDSILQKYENDMINWNDLRLKIKNNCENKKKTFKENFIQFKSVVDCDDLKKINEAIKRSCHNLDKDIRTFENNQVQILSTFVNNYKSDINFDCALQTDLKKSWNDEMVYKIEFKEGEVSEYCIYLSLYGH